MSEEANRFCSACGVSIDSEARFCSGCGRQVVGLTQIDPASESSSNNAPSNAKAISIAVGAILFALSVLLVPLLYVTIEMTGVSPTSDPLQSIKISAAEDAKRQYDTAKAAGSPADACVHAGVVAEAYNQAHDDDKYAEWKRTQRIDCALAGVPNL